MKTFVFGLLALFTVAACSGGSSGGSPDQGPTVLEGNWQVTEMTFGGKKLKADESGFIKFSEKSAGMIMIWKFRGKTYEAFTLSDKVVPTSLSSKGEFRVEGDKIIMRDAEGKESPNVFMREKDALTILHSRDEDKSVFKKISQEKLEQLVTTYGKNSDGSLVKPGQFDFEFSGTTSAGKKVAVRANKTSLPAAMKGSPRLYCALLEHGSKMVLIVDAEDQGIKFGLNINELEVRDGRHIIPPEKMVSNMAFTAEGLLLESQGVEMISNIASSIQPCSAVLEIQSDGVSGQISCEKALATPIENSNIGRFNGLITTKFECHRF